MPDVTRSGETAVLVGLDFGSSGFSESVSELSHLAQSAGIYPAATVLGKRVRPDSATFAGSGKVAEIAEVAHRHRVSAVIFNHELTPGQERNLEQAIGVRVIDRVNLILEIFARRAKSHEGKLQVELAQFERMSTRLIRGWTHLERQRGGIGLRGGPGETQLEIDRRLIANRIKTLKSRLAQFRKTRAVQRRARAQGQSFKVSLVGYTNAGKSTLFNRIANSRSYAADKLFATLDTTTRRVYLSPKVSLALSDTVGFIRELPHTLVEAFRATLEEVAYADLLLHVVDASSPVRDDQIAQVDAVLAEVGANEVPRLLVYNKIDLCEGRDPEVLRDAYGRIVAVRVSAATGAGLDNLRMALRELGEALWKRPSATSHDAEPMAETH